MLSTLLRPTRGRAELAGFDVVREPTGVRQSIGMVFQDPSLDDRLTADENLRFHAIIYDVPRRVRDERISACSTSSGWPTGGTPSCAPSPAA